MKKLHKKGGKVHPSPPPQSQHPINHLISLLPATILTLTAALSPEDKVVLAYLISCSGNTNTNTNTNTKKNKTIEEHGPRFKCNCFRCYISYWVRWDTSPNRELIHEIIEEYEEGLFRENKNVTTKPNSNINNKKKKTRSNKMTSPSSSPVNTVTINQQGKKDGGPVELAEVKGGGVDSFRDVDDDVENGSFRRIVSFLGEKIWSVWN